MVNVMKSPNMMSTTGRRPVMAAPTARPVKPASEIGVSSTRSLPNSSTRPESTLKGVPASATSSPRMQTRGSRRISSASASRTASAKVSSRVATADAISALGINILGDFVGPGERRFNGELHRGINRGFHFVMNAVENSPVSEFVISQPCRQIFDGIAFVHPALLFLLGPVVLPIDVADVVPAIAIGVAQQKRGPLAFPRTIHHTLGDVEHGTHVLAINRFSVNAECGGARQNVTRGGFGKMGVLVVEIIFANIDDRQSPELCQVHDFVEHTLSEGAFSEKTYGHGAVVQVLGGKSCAGRDPYAARHNGIRAEIAGRGIGNMHRTTLPAAVSRLLAQQLGKHAVGRGALGQAMSMTTMGAGDAILQAQCLAHSDSNGFFADVQMRQPRHQRTRVEIVDLLFKQTNAHHLAVHVEPLFGSDARGHIGLTRGHCHFPTPDFATPAMWASTSKTIAKSCSSRPMARAAVRNSFEMAVVGRGTFSFRPMSSASSMSFCIMFTLNHASSGCLSTKGPRY